METKHQLPSPVVKMYGVHISKWTMAETIAQLTEWIEHSPRQSHQVVTANPVMMMAALEDESFMEVMQSAELVVPDGIGIVLAARIVGNPIQERVAGFDLALKLLDIGSERKYRVYLLGSSQATIKETVRQIAIRYPGVQVVGSHHGFFGPKEDEEIVENIRLAKPDLLLVARGLDTQEPWIGKYKKRLEVPVIMGVGGTFDVIAGNSKRAPLFVQKIGMEWFYRLVREPTRFKRMLVLPKFAFKVVRERNRVQL